MYYLFYPVSFRKRDVRQGLLGSAVTLSVDVHQMPKGPPLLLLACLQDWSEAAQLALTAGSVDLGLPSQFTTFWLCDLGQPSVSCEQQLPHL